MPALLAFAFELGVAACGTTTGPNDGGLAGSSGASSGAGRRGAVRGAAAFQLQRCSSDALHSAHKELSSSTDPIEQLGARQF